MTEHFSKLYKNLAFKSCCVIARMSQGMNVKADNAFCFIECLFKYQLHYKAAVRKLPRHCYTRQLALVFMLSFTKIVLLSELFCELMHPQQVVVPTRCPGSLIVP